MKNHPRDAKGRFLKLRMNAEDWRRLLDERFADIEREKQSVKYYRDETAKLRKRISEIIEQRDSYLKALHIVQKSFVTSEKRQTLAICIWTTVAFVLGTVVFMIISKL